MTKKYTVVNTNAKSLNFTVVDPKGTVVATFNSEKRANHSANAMEVMKDKYNDRD